MGRVNQLTGSLRGCATGVVCQASQVGAGGQEMLQRRGELIRDAAGVGLHHVLSSWVARGLRAWEPCSTIQV